MLSTGRCALPTRKRLMALAGDPLELRFKMRLARHRRGTPSWIVEDQAFGRRSRCCSSMPAYKSTFRQESPRRVSVDRFIRWDNDRTQRSKIARHAWSRLRHVTVTSWASAIAASSRRVLDPPLVISRSSSVPPLRPAVDSASCSMNPPISRAPVRRHQLRGRVRLGRQPGNCHRIRRRHRLGRDHGYRIADRPRSGG